MTCADVSPAEWVILNWYPVALWFLCLISHIHSETTAHASWGDGWNGIPIVLGVYNDLLPYPAMDNLLAYCCHYAYSRACQSTMSAGVHFGISSFLILVRTFISVSDPAYYLLAVACRGLVMDLVLPWWFISDTKSANITVMFPVWSGMQPRLTTPATTN